MKGTDIGTPIWSNGFGCVTWVGEHAAGVLFLADGEPKITGFVPVTQAAYWAQRWLDLMSEDGRVEAVDTGAVPVVQ
jgi:hypothetical protein